VNEAKACAVVDINLSRVMYIIQKDKSTSHMHIDKSLKIRRTGNGRKLSQ
jgi:hypothetical protein